MNIVEEFEYEGYMSQKVQEFFKGELNEMKKKRT